MAAITLAIAKEKCKNLKVGDSVVIKEKVKDVGDGRSGIIKTPATILARYHYHILVEHKREPHTKECFTYIDIAVTGCIEKKMGKPSKV